MGSGAGTAVGVVTELVDVHAAQGLRVVALEVVGDVRRGALALLLKRHDAVHRRVAADESHCATRAVVSPAWCRSTTCGGVGKGTLVAGLGETTSPVGRESTQDTMSKCLGLVCEELRWF